MPRELSIGNGSLLINIDRGLDIRDLFYPFVGQWNHIMGNRNSFGVWSEGRFSWVGEGNWWIRTGYLANTLITHCIAENLDMGVRLTIRDAVHHRDNIYLKAVEVENLLPRDREIRLFFTHDFSIDETDVGDTAAYDPDLHTLYHFKKNKYFMINGAIQGEGFHQFATGTKRFKGAEGTWRDAEDGELSGNPIAQGSVDSTVGFRMHLPAGQKALLHYWISVGRKFQEVKALDGFVREKGVEELFQDVACYWQSWLNLRPQPVSDLSPQMMDLYRRSLLVVHSHMDRRGAIVAATDSDIMQTARDHYCYVWPRDGAMIASALIHAGYGELTRNFFRYCDNALTEAGYFLQKYNPDGTAGSTWHPWYKNGQRQLPIQEDETALVLLALWEYYRETGDLKLVKDVYPGLVTRAGRFLASYLREEWNLPDQSYDLWEERRGIFTFTSSAVFGGLTAAARLAEVMGDEAGERLFRQKAQQVREGVLEHLYDPILGRFVRGVYPEEGGLRKDLTPESSLFGLFRFGLLPADDPRVAATMESIEASLWVKTSIGGMARYAGDYYFKKSDDLKNVPGNPWPICTLWLAQWHIAKARTMADLTRAREILQWVVNRTMESGVLPEQVHPYDGSPLSVAPLTWSHGEYVYTVAQYGAKYRQFDPGGRKREVCPER